MQHGAWCMILTTSGVEYTTHVVGPPTMYGLWCSYGVKLPVKGAGQGAGQGGRGNKMKEEVEGWRGGGEAGQGWRRGEVKQERGEWIILITI